MRIFDRANMERVIANIKFNMFCFEGSDFYVCKCIYACVIYE